MRLILILGIFCSTIAVYGQNKLAEHSIYFNSASTTISEIEERRFIEFLETLAGQTIVTCWIIGFADDVGQAQSNVTLSNIRANSTEKLLQVLKPYKDKLTVKGEGSIALTKSSAVEILQERKKNRRVDVQFEIIQEEPRVVPMAVQEPKALLTENIAVGEKIRLNNILFEPGSHIMFRESHEELERLIFYLKKYENLHISIQGHICCQTEEETEEGEDAVDKDTGLKNLSESRAQAVYFYLIRKGIDKNRLDYKGMKGDYPLGFGDQEDRRVEIQITKN